MKKKIFTMHDGRVQAISVSLPRRIEEVFVFNFKKKVSLIIHNVHKSDDGRIMLINIEYEQNVITLVNIYAPNSESERCKFFKKLTSWVSHYCLLYK